MIGKRLSNNDLDLLKENIINITPHKVFYNIDTGIVYSEEYRKSQNILNPESFTPTKEGYTFIGYRTDKTASKEVFDTLLMGEEDISLYAVFAKNLTVSFDANGGDTISQTEQLETIYNNSNNLYPEYTLDLTPTRNEPIYTFGGWYMNSTSGTIYNNEQVVSISSDTIFYAKWNEIANYSCTFNSGAKTEGENWGSATLPFGSIKSQNISLLSVSGGNIVANYNMKASSLSLTVVSGRANSGNGNGANSSIKIYRNSTLLKTQVLEIAAYWYTNSANISVSLPALSKGDIIKVTMTHDEGNGIGGNFHGTISSASVSY